MLRDKNRVEIDETSGTPEKLFMIFELEMIFFRGLGSLSGQP